MAESVRESINRELHKITCWGDYVGDITQRINSDFLIHEFPNSVVLFNAGDYGTTAIRLGTRVQPGVLAQLLDFIDGFRNYPDITVDSNFGENRMTELVEESIKSIIIPEIECRLNEILDWEDNTLLNDKDAVIAAIMDTEAPYHFETASNFYMDTPDALLDQIIHALLIDYSVTITKSVFTQIDDLFTGLEILQDCC